MSTYLSFLAQWSDGPMRLVLDGPGGSGASAESWSGAARVLIVSLIVVFGFVCVGASLALWLKYRSAPPSDARVAADVGAALGLTPADLKTLGQLAGGAGVGAGRVVGLMLSPSALARAVEERLAESHARKEVALMKALLDRLG